MSPKDEQDPLDRLVDAYEKMLERVDEAFDKAHDSTLPALKKNIDHARERAVELGELTREEADKIAGYLERDMKDAGEYLAKTGEEFRNWMRFDLELIEDRLLEMFASVADQTRVELEKLAEQARRASIYHTGEITGPGTLVCSGCGNELHFKKTGHIPPCPKCHATEYRRG